ncbi:helix-turn-helix domain-containing protein [Roseateles puraquae]|uniref:helix-turn-helix domain-containing protein n=1 Tax=Roseateles puraquae TaxID=431059 RepID=UPI0024084A31|nr:helix-turn-helix domain-containing protein [Roseateles puraquae]
MGRLTTCRPGAAWFSKACKASGSAALAQVGGNISQAAKLLGVSRAALYRKLDKHGL